MLGTMIEWLKLKWKAFIGLFVQPAPEETCEDIGGADEFSSKCINCDDFMECYDEHHKAPYKVEPRVTDEPVYKKPRERSTYISTYPRSTFDEVYVPSAPSIIVDEDDFVPTPVRGYDVHDTFGSGIGGGAGSSRSWDMPVHVYDEPARYSEPPRSLSYSSPSDSSSSSSYSSSSDSSSSYSSSSDSSSSYSSSSSDSSYSSSSSDSSYSSSSSSSSSSDW